MPIELDAFDKLVKERKKPKSVDWDEVIEHIIESGQYWSVNEVHNDLVHCAVTRFRVKTVLDKAAKEGKLTIGFGRAFHYGAPLKKKRKRRRKEK